MINLTNRFQKLLLESITSEIKGSTCEKLVQVKQIFESEMLWEKCFLSEPVMQKRLQDWLQGLCSTVSMPYMNDDIIEWNETTLGRKAKQHQRDNNHGDESDRWVEDYWIRCAKELYEMLYS